MDLQAGAVKPRFGRVQCIGPAGLHRMAYTEWGDPDNPRVLVCVHGLTRTGRDFDVLAARLASHFRVICPDVVGRGRSDWLSNPNFYVIPQYVADMLVLLRQLNIASVAWLGTSMGGLIGLVLAAMPHAPIERLLLNDVGPRIEGGALGRIADYLRPMQFETEQQGLDYLARISAPFGSHTPEQWRALNLPMLRPKKLSSEAQGFELHYDPAIAIPFNSCTLAGAMASESALWQTFEAIRCPILVVRGEFSDLLARATVERMRAGHASVSSIEIKDVGHAPTFVAESQLAIAEAFFAAGPSQSKKTSPLGSGAIT